MPECRFRVVSSHPRVSSEQLVATLVKSMPALTRRLRRQWPEVTVKADREQSVPVDPLTAYLVIKFVGTTAAGALLGSMVKDSYEYLKDCIKNGTLRPVETSTTRARTAKPRPASRVRKKARKKSPTRK